MNRFSTPKMLMISLVLGLGTLVLTGCQKRTVEASPPQTEVAAAPESETPSTPEPELVKVEQPASAPRPQPVAAPRPVAPPPEPPPAPVTAEAPAPVMGETPAPASPRQIFVTVPAGTILAVAVDKTLSSHTSEVGENFRGFLTQDVAAQGRVALPKDTVVIGRVTEASPAKKIGGRARLSLEFYSLKLPTGQQAPLEAVFASAGKSQTPKDAAIIGGSTLGGAILGRAVDKGEGTAIGAIVGGLAGAAIANETKGKPVEVPAGTVLTLETTQSVTIELLQ